MISHGAASRPPIHPFAFGRDVPGMGMLLRETKHEPNTSHKGSVLLKFVVFFGFR